MSHCFQPFLPKTQSIILKKGRKMNTPLKDLREKCWNSRDEYWKCLDKNNEQNDKCVDIRKLFEKHCSKQWVQHFDRRRKYELFKAKANEVGWAWPEENKKV